MVDLLSTLCWYECDDIHLFTTDDAKLPIHKPIKMFLNEMNVV